MNETLSLAWLSPEPQSLISLAGSELARRRHAAGPARQKRIRMTGRVHGRRRRVGQLIVLPGRQLGELVAALRGTVVVKVHDPFALIPLSIGKYDEDKIALYRLPVARLLGSLKQGKKERPSSRKQRACR
jgi:hypothetical protein